VHNVEPDYNVKLKIQHNCSINTNDGIPNER